MNVDQKISLSFMCRFLDRLKVPPTLLLQIPYQALPLYSTKPRKWLHYAAYAICGCDGKLRFKDQDEDADLNEGVSPGDHFVFHLDGPAHYVDWNLRDGTSSISWTSLSSGDRLLDRYYGGCPFTKHLLDVCQVSHLIPQKRGDSYLHKLACVRDISCASLEIDFPQNMLLLGPPLHSGLDREKEVIFIKTPNIALKSNELPGLGGVEPNDYRVTVHSLHDRSVLRRNVSHGYSSDLKRASGVLEASPGPSEEEYETSSHPIEEDTSSSESSREDSLEDFRPKDVLLDLVYANGLLRKWGSDAAKELIVSHNKNLYRSSKVETAAKKRERERRDDARSERANKRRRTDEEDGEAGGDSWDFLLDLSYLVRYTSAEDIEVKCSENRRQTVQNKAEHLAEWQKTLP